MILSIISIVLAAAVIFLLWPRNRKAYNANSFPENWIKLLNENVIFYKNLDEAGKEKFKERVKIFLDEVRITGVETPVDDQLKILVAASAIIPIFGFHEWEYLNLNEVLIYDGMVETYQIEEREKKNDILGQVRPFQSRHVLLLSRQSLEKGFANYQGKENVGFHEFIHLLDEADGAIDGVPKLIMSKELIKPWSHLMYKEIEKIKKGESDINPYGLTNHAEFFAVVCEYFFENPGEFKHKHPELYLVLSKAFKRE